MQMSQRPETVINGSQEVKDLLRSEVSQALEAVLSTAKGSVAFSGIDPIELRRRISCMDFLPEEGLGFEPALSLMKDEVLDHMLRTWSTEYMPHLHSPSLLESIACELIIAAYNDSMDSWDQSPAATEVELAVVRRLCSLVGYGEGSDGVFTSGGSQSNLSAITGARDAWCSRSLGWDVKKHGNPEEAGRLRLYTSAISHFSMEKSCHLLGLGYESVVKLPVDDMCRIDLGKAEEIIAKDVAEGRLPFCIVATIGTTDYGSVDDLAGLRKLADKYGAHLHADAAYGSGALMSRRFRGRIGDLSLADSVTVDFHKMFLLPISCSAILVKDASLLDCFSLHADYLNREEDEEDGYVNLVGKSIQTTRRADALKVAFSFLVRGRRGFEEIIDTVIGNADHLYRLLEADDDFIAPVRPTLSSVVFALKGGDEVNKAARRRLMAEGLVLGQTVKDGRVMLKATLLNPALGEDDLAALLERVRSCRGA